MIVTVFGYLNLISIDFVILLLYFLLSLSFNSEDISNSPHLTTISKHIEICCKHSAARVVLSTPFSVKWNVVKHGLSCLISLLIRQHESRELKAFCSHNFNFFEQFFSFI